MRKDRSVRDFLQTTFSVDPGSFLFRKRTRRSFVPDVVRDPLRRLSGAGPDGRTNKAGRTRHGTYRTFPRGTHTTQPRSPSTACWEFLGRQGRPHLLNSLLLRLHSELTWRKSTAKTAVMSLMAIFRQQPF